MPAGQTLKITNNLQPLQHFIMLGRLLFTYTLHRAQERGIQRGYFILKAWQPFEQLVARSTAESCAVRDTVATGNIEALNGMAPKGTNTLL
ncbi:MAG: hypothetical protein J6V00_09355, partial [Bacteroidaceae bacterium]|nr:hypothetical protein [Bacteroidaceae bacterium]